MLNGFFILLVFLFMTLPFLGKLYASGKRDRLFGTLALRWNMRFSRRDILQVEKKIAGSYLFPYGHSRKVTSIVSGKHRAMPISIFDFSCEMGGSRHCKIKKTVVIADPGTYLPDLVIVPHLNINQYGRYVSFCKIDLLNVFPAISSHNSIMSYFGKSHIHSDKKYLLGQSLSIEMLEAITMIKTSEIEFYNNKILVWTDQVASELRLAQLAGRVIRLARLAKNTIEKNN